MVHQLWYEYGNTFGMRYLFEQRGDGLAMHQHPAGEEHNCWVLRGAVRVSAPGWPGIVVTAPTNIEILPPRHEIVALEPGTECLNLYKNGKPVGYAEMPEEEHRTQFETRPLENPL